jgi:hypothetical protein
MCLVASDESYKQVQPISRLPHFQFVDSGLRGFVQSLIEIEIEIQFQNHSCLTPW